MTMLPVILLLLGQAAGPERVVLTGTVIGPDGKPAAGAEVVLTDDATWMSQFPFARATTAVLRPPAVLETLRADADGRFRVELPEHGELTFRSKRPIFVWAFGPGGALAMRPVPIDWPSDGESVRMALARPQPVRFLVLDPEERPVAAARLAPAWFRGVVLPAGLIDRLAVETDTQGRATLDIGAAEDVEVVRVTSGPFGVQQLRMPRPEPGGVRTLRLMPVGRVVGRIQAGDPQAVRRLAVRVWTDPGPAANLPGAGGSASVVTDDQGRFTIPAIAPGTLVVSFEHRWDLPWRGQWRPGGSKVQPGATTEVTIPLARAGLVKGVVQEAPSGRPIAGVGVSVAINPDFPLARTDANGRFAAFVMPGVVRANAADLPLGYYDTTRITAGSRPTLTEGMAELALEPIWLRRGVELRGRVLDAKGRPVPAADVAGRSERAGGRGGPFSTVTDHHGRFRITGLGSDATVYLSAVRGEATTAAPVTVLSSKGTIDLTIAPENAVALVGRVKDPAGRPVAGAAVRVTSRTRNQENVPLRQFPVAFDDEGRTVLRTGADGQFRTPKQLRPDMDYHVDVEADGYVAAGTEWIPPGDRKLWYVPALTLQPATTIRTVAGRAVDSQGRPIAGAVVFQSGDGPARTRTTTGPDGRFRLPGVYREPAFLFVEGDGLAFEGHRVGAGDAAVELRVRREGEPAAGPPLHTLPPVLPREDEKALARSLIGTDLTLLTGEATSETYTLAHLLGRVDFDRAWDVVQRHAVGDPYVSEALRLECAYTLRATSFEEAASVAETLKDPALRSLFYCRASDALPKADRARKLDLLNKALLHARAAPRPDNKLSALGRIGIRLLELGETGRATEVLREGQRLAESLPKRAARGKREVPAVVRGRFAPALARIDARAALELAEGFSEPGNTSYKGGVALVLADRDPAQSEQIFARLTDKQQRDGKVIRAAGRMAAVDRERARRLIEMLDQPRDQAVALGAMAQTLADTDRKGASAILDEAFGRLEKLARTEVVFRKTLACVAACHLLPTAEKVDPDLLRRGFWRAVAMRPPRPAGGDRTGWYDEGIADLAIALARFDRAVARQVLEPVAARARSLVERNPASRGHDVFAAATMIDPAWAVALADALPDDTPGKPMHPKAAIRRVIADVLAYTGPELWEHLNDHFLYFEGDSTDREW